VNCGERFTLLNFPESAPAADSGAGGIGGVEGHDLTFAVHVFLHRNPATAGSHGRNKFRLHPAARAASIMSAAFEAVVHSPP